MKLVTFLRDYAGYREGSSQYYSEPYAEELIKMGLVREAYSDESEKPEEINEEVVTMDKREEQVEEKKKALDTPVKDKMLRMPRKKK